MPNRLRALIVAFSPDDSGPLAAHLRASAGGLEPVIATSEEEFRAALRREPWDVILCACALEGTGISSALGIARAEAPDVPDLVVTHRRDQCTVEAMRGGARDLIASDDLTGLLPAIEREIGEARARKAERTRLHASEEELRASEERFRALFANGPIPMWVYSMETRRFLEVNEAAVAQYGYTRDEFLAMTIEQIRPPAEVERLRVLLESPLPVIGTAGLWKHRRKDGTLIDVHVTGHTLQFGGEPMRLMVAEDVTQRLARDRALEERAVAASLLADVSVALTRGDSLEDALHRCASAFVMRLSAPLARIWTVDESLNALVLAASAGLLPAPSDAAQHLPLDGDGLLARAAASKKALAIHDIAAEPRLRDREWAASAGRLSLLVKPVVLEGRLVGLIAVFAARPPGAVIVEALGPVSDALALGIRRKLVERAHEEVEAQLRQSQKMEAIGSLAGGIAHDFNNLLSVIVSYSALVSNELPQGHPSRRDLGEIGAAASRAASLTRQLLAFSRRQLLQPRVVDVNAIVRGMDNMLRRLIGENIELAFVPSTKPAKVNVDPGQLEQVILNLALNARDAMPDGGRLTLEVQRLDLGEAYAATHPDVVPGTWVMLAVSDTGVGMDKATQARAFEPFFTTKEIGKGTGLGLSTVFGIVRQSGGQVTAYSERGRGSTFKVYLPWAAAEPVEAPTPPPANATSLRGAETVLLVEDEESVRRVARAVLQRNGYTVLEATSGGDALLTAEQHPEFDVLLTDLVMPKMSGTQLADRLRATRPSLPVVYMSGYTDDSVVAHGVLPSEVEFVQKPFTPEALLHKLRSALHRPAPTPPAPPRVLVIDDDPLILRLLPRALRGCDVVTCDDARKALLRLRDGERFAAIVCDVNMPGLGGPALEAELARFDPAAAERIIFLTGGALDVASADFLAARQGRVLQKPADVKALRAAVAAAVERAPKR